MQKTIPALTFVLAGAIGAWTQTPTGASKPPAAYWPQFRGPGGSGVSTEKVPVTWGPDKHLVWKTKLPGPGSSSPVVVGDRVFITCHSGYGVPNRPQGDMDQLQRHLLCLDRRTGKVLWSKEIKSVLPEEPYQARMHNHGYASSTPAADGERVYVFFGKTGVFACDHDGRQIWHADVGAQIHGWGSGASLLIHDNLVIVNASVESESLRALDKRNGKEAWRVTGIRESWSTPLLVDVPGKSKELVVPMVGKILGLDPATGKERWSCEGLNNYMCPSPAAHAGVVYCTGGRERTTLAIRAGGEGDVTRTHLLWKVKKGSNVSSPIIHEGHVYLANDMGGIATCLDAKTGETVYEQRLGRVGEVYASPLLADGKLYYLGRHGGEAVVLAAGPEFQELARNSLGDRSRSNATPAVAAGQLLIRTDEFLYCIAEQQ